MCLMYVGQATLASRNSRGKVWIGQKMLSVGTALKQPIKERFTFTALDI